MSLQSVEEQFRSYMLGDTRIAAQLSGRWYLEPLPQNSAFPAVLLTRIATVRNWVRARGGQFSDMGWCRLQVDIYDNSGKDSAQTVSQLAQYVIERLRSFNAYNSGNGGSNRVLNQQLRPVPELQPPGYRAILDVKSFFSDNT